MASVRHNVVFNYLGQFYTAAAGIVTLPLYLSHLGAEAYGLVGFFTLLQAWMQLLDLGISPTFSREVARLHGKPEQAGDLRSVVRSLEAVFLVIALLVTLPLFLARHWIGTHWLSVERLDPGLVANCIGIMSIMLGLRWLIALHRSGINAYERQAWVNIANGIFVTLRFPGSLLLIVLTRGDLLLFFLFQLALAFIEQVLTSRKFYQLLPSRSQGAGSFSLGQLRRIAPFALSVGYTGGIWVLITQMDKLLMSKLLPLSEYGYFSLIATVSSSILMLSWPIGTAIMPRMTALLAHGQDAEMLRIYRKATRFVVCTVTPLALALAFFPAKSVYLWTGDARAAEWTAPILPLFALGNALLAVSAFQYYLQYAYGRLRMHVQYNTFSVFISVPLIVYAAYRYGPLGVGWVWLGLRIFSLTIWSYCIHRVFTPGLHQTWLLKDVLAPVAGCCLAFLAVAPSLDAHFPANRYAGIATLAGVVLIIMALAILAAFNHDIRGHRRAKLQSRQFPSAPLAE